MAYLYQAGIALYTLAIRVAALFNPKARAWIRGRKGWKKEIAEAFNPGDKVIWVHAASLGEFEQGRPVIEALGKEYPSYKILLTFFSPSGYEQRKDYDAADKVMYLPADCRRNARYFTHAFHPVLAIFIKYEFWYNYLSELHKQDVPVVFISALFRRQQAFFRSWGGWFRSRLRNVDHFFVQDDASAEMLTSIGITSHTRSGDTRFDRVADILSSGGEDQDVARFCKGRQVLLSGSTWPPDEEILSSLHGKFPDLKLIIAPHEVNEERIAQLIKTMGLPAARYTTDDPVTWPDKQLLVIDTIGVLSSIYRYADVAYIGGAFGSGLHNIQEPAVNGMPVIFGPEYSKFREAIDLVRLGGAFSIRSAEQMQQQLSALLNSKELYHEACRISREYMIAQTGATRRIMKGLKDYL